MYAVIEFDIFPSVSVSFHPKINKLLIQNKNTKYNFLLYILLFDILPHVHWSLMSLILSFLSKA